MSEVGLEGHTCIALNAHPIWETPPLLFEVLKLSCERVRKKRGSIIPTVPHRKH